MWLVLAMTVAAAAPDKRPSLSFAISPGVTGGGNAALDALRAALAQETAGSDAIALSTIDRLVSTHPSWELPRLEAARLRLKMGVGLDRAEFDADVARSLAPENPRAHYLWALTQVERGNSALATSALKTAVVLRSDFVDAQVRLGALLFAAGDFAGAVDAYRQYVRAHADAIGPRLQLADALDRAGDATNAERELRALYKLPNARVVAGRKLAEFFERHGRRKEAASIRVEVDGPAKSYRPLR